MVKFLKIYFFTLMLVLFPAISSAQSFQIQQINSGNGSGSNASSQNLMPWQVQQTNQQQGQNQIQQQIQPQQMPSFQAFVDRQGVAAGQAFQIKLELANADAHSAPDISVFPDSIKVERQSQKSSFSMVNGVRSKSMSWVYDVLGEKQGTIKIPAISIQTDQGTLYTKPFRIYVKNASELPANTEDNSVYIESEVYNKEPFIDQPVTYKARVYHLDAIDDAELITPKSENAVIEQITEPRKGTQALNGVKYNIIEVTYSVTPIREGEVTIEPTILRGKQVKKTNRNTGNSGAFDNFFDPFSMFDSPRAFQKEIVPFTVASNKITLKVKGGNGKVKPWLPLHSLKISGEFIDVDEDSKTGILKGKVGEPINRKIILNAVGAIGDKLPDVESLISNSDFKLYADKPVGTKKFEGNPDDKSPLSEKIQGEKTQTFTLIPQKQGNLIIPEIKIPFWNLSENKADEATLPAVKIVIFPSKNNPQNSYNPPAVNKNETVNKSELKNEQSDGGESAGFNYIYLIIIIFLIIILIVLIVIVLGLKNKGDKKEEPKEVGDKNFIPRKINEPSTNKLSLKELLDSQNVKEFQTALQNYAQENLDISNKAGVTVIAQQVARKFNLDKAKAIKLASEIDYAIYSGGKIDFEKTKQEFLEIMHKVNIKLKSKDSSVKNKDAEFERLNPEI